MSFGSPLVLVALCAIPVFVVLYSAFQRQRRAAAAAFVTPALADSVAPHRPGWRRHLPMVLFALALLVLILAAARPQKSVAVAVNNAAVVLANDVSSSMAATDLKPSRLRAAEVAGNRFLASLPSPRAPDCSSSTNTQPCCNRRRPIASLFVRRSRSSAPAVTRRSATESSPA